jgi:hypothetical protein
VRDLDLPAVAPEVRDGLVVDHTLLGADQIAEKIPVEAAIAPP